MDVYTIEYPIRLVRTADGWRVDEFHSTDFGYAEAVLEPPLSEQDLQVPVPEFLTAEQQMVYQRAYKMMLVRAGTYLIDDPQYFPCESPGHRPHADGYCHCRRVRLHARAEPLPELGYVLRRAAGYFHEGFS